MKALLAVVALVAGFLAVAWVSVGQHVYNIGMEAVMAFLNWVSSHEVQ